ncbi:MAG: hypothetical protein P9X24_10895 [Candidatus Hatepunaea meridiana]|nr:hypothetical protein [Candidatus Hatepunaea meridiana]
MLRLIVIVIIALTIRMTYVLAQGRWVQQSSLPTRDFVWGQLWFNSSTSGWYTDLIHSRIWHTSDGGENWTAIQLNVEGTSGIFFKDESHGWIGAYVPGGGIFSTVNGGDDWELQAVGPYGDIYLGSFRDFYFLNESVGWAVGGETWGIDDEYITIKRAVMQTLNGGEDWSVILFEEWENESPQDSIPIREFKHVAFADSLNGIIAPAPGFYVTEDGGESLGQLQYPDFYVYDIVCIDNEDYLLAGGRVQRRLNQAQILKSRNGGAVWDTVYSLVSDETSFIAELAMVPGSEDGWAIGSRDNDFSPLVLKTTNSGDEWENVEFPNFNDLMDIFFFDSLNGWIITLDNEILSYEPENKMDGNDQSPPTGFSFVQVYPNPFNCIVSIEVNTSQSCSVFWQLLTSNGRILQNGNAGTFIGTNNLYLNLRSFPAGEYYCHLTMSYPLEIKHQVIGLSLVK